MVYIVAVRMPAADGASAVEVQAALTASDCSIAEANSSSHLAVYECCHYYMVVEDADVALVLGKVVVEEHRSVQVLEPDLLIMHPTYCHTLAVSVEGEEDRAILVVGAVEEASRSGQSAMVFAFLVVKVGRVVVRLEDTFAEIVPNLT